ncbi:MAG: hypothetical protein ACE5H4_09825 [Candidatus Thorarchaeota archaeon]
MRSFAGALFQTPIWCFTTDYEGPLSSAAKSKLGSLDAVVFPFELGQGAAEFALAGHVEAVALAESRARGQSRLLAWLAPNTLVLQEPEEFLLQRGKSLGYKPVHH